MQDPASLQEPFTYNGSIIILILLMIIGLLIAFFYKKKEYNNNNVPYLVHYPNLLTIKNTYLQELDQLLYKVNNHNLNNRDAYYELSMIIRNFIYLSTHINVLTLSLSELDNYNIPYLKELMSEYYTPEFSLVDSGNIINSINHAKEVIYKWR